MNRLSDINNIDLFLKKLGTYWKCNQDLSFGEVVAILDSKSKLGIFNSENSMLDFILHKLTLESCYPELRQEITQVYLDKLNSLEEVDRQDLINVILEWYLSGEAYIASTGMRIRVEAYLSTKS